MDPKEPCREEIDSVGEAKLIPCKEFPAKEKPSTAAVLVQIIPQICRRCHQLRLCQIGRKQTLPTADVHHQFCPLNLLKRPSWEFSMQDRDIWERCPACQEQVANRESADASKWQNVPHDFGCPYLHGQRTMRESPSVDSCFACIESVEMLFNESAKVVSPHHPKCPHAGERDKKFVFVERSKKVVRQREAIDHASLAVAEECLTAWFT